MDLHPSSQAVNAILAAAGLPGRVRILSEPAPTAPAAARQIGCPVGAIANSLVFATADDEPVLIMTSGRHRVPDGGHPADGLAGVLPDELGTGPAEADPDRRAHPYGIDPVRTTGHDQQRPPVVGGENQRVGDRADRTADLAGCGRGRWGRLGQ